MKLKPHHDLATLQARFATVEDLQITVTALLSADELGFLPEDIVDVVQALENQDFVKSETAHNPKNNRMWHDSYTIPYGGYWLYLKFAGEALIDVRLTSFKESV